MIKKITLVLLVAVCVVSVSAFTGVQKLSLTKWSGIASYYHHKFNGRKTATGEIFRNTYLTAANNFLPLGTIVKVTNIANGLSVIVRINDRMNFKNKRLIDLTQAAASKIGLIDKGIGEVELEIITDNVAIN